MLEVDQATLIGSIGVALERPRLEQSPDADTEKDIQTITHLAQAILKREWQRVKLGR